MTKRPPVTIPLERSSRTNLPGRPGSLMQLEGEDVYDDMILTSTCFISDPAQIPIIAVWPDTSAKVCMIEVEDGCPEVIRYTLDELRFA